MPGAVNTAFILDMQRKLYRWSPQHPLRAICGDSRTRRAGCLETCTSGSERGMEKLGSERR